MLNNIVSNNVQRVFGCCKQLHNNVDNCQTQLPLMHLSACSNMCLSTFNNVVHVSVYKIQATYCCTTHAHHFDARQQFETHLGQVSCNMYGKSSRIWEDFPCMFVRTQAYYRYSPNMGGDFQHAGSLPINGKPSHVWEDFPYTRRLPSCAKSSQMRADIHK
jgi:hypothetical protein